jgi:hypothetical protein
VTEAVQFTGRESITAVSTPPSGSLAGSVKLWGTSGFSDNDTGLATGGTLGATVVVVVVVATLVVCGGSVSWGFFVAASITAISPESVSMEILTWSTSVSPLVSIAVTVGTVGLSLADIFRTVGEPRVN